jgi:hypothetical protein
MCCLPYWFVSNFLFYPVVEGNVTMDCDKSMETLLRRCVRFVRDQGWVFHTLHVLWACRNSLVYRTGIECSFESFS